MIDKIKAYIDEVEQFSADKIEDIENFRIQYFL